MMYSATWPFVRSTVGSYPFSPENSGGSIYNTPLFNNYKLLGPVISAYAPKIGAWASSLFTRPDFSPRGFVSDTLLAPLAWASTGLGSVASVLPTCGVSGVFAQTQLANARAALGAAQAWVNSIANNILGNNSLPSAYVRVVLKMNGTCFADDMASVVPTPGITPVVGW